MATTEADLIRRRGFGPIEFPTPPVGPPGVLEPPGPDPDLDPDVALLPPVLPGINQPPSRIFIPDAPPATGPGIAGILSRAGLITGIGVVAIELLERIAAQIQESRFRRLEEEAEAQIRMTRGRILARQKIEELELETEAAGDLVIPPTGRTPGLSDIPQFPFPDPAKSPLGDDPLPPTTPPGPPLLPVPIEVDVPTEAPTPAPVAIPGPETPTLPEVQPQPGPATRPGTATPLPSPTPTPSPFPLPAPRPVPSPRTAPFPLPFAFPTPSAQPRPFSPGQPTPTPTDIPLPDLTPFDVPGVPLQAPVRDSRCPPCEEEALEPRSECFKKLVKEGLFPDQDESFNWVEIDCLTGKEI